MADYSEFPFHIYSTDELAKLFIDSVKCDDREFAKAALEEIKKRKVILTGRFHGF